MMNLVTNLFKLKVIMKTKIRLRTWLFIKESRTKKKACFDDGK